MWDRVRNFGKVKQFTYPDTSSRADSGSVKVCPRTLLIFRNADEGSARAMGRRRGVDESFGGLEEVED